MSDLIDRQAAIDMITNHWSDFSNKKNYKVALACVDAVPPALPEPMKIDLSRCSEENWERIKKEWANTPITAITAEPERIKGHWIKISPANIYECSECGKSVMTNDICAYDFCHGCGAEMESEVTE